MGKTVSLELPEDLVGLWKSEKELIAKIREALTLDLVRKHKKTFREGAALVGMNYGDFLDFLSENHVPVLDCGPGEIGRELQALEEFGCSR